MSMLTICISIICNFLLMAREAANLKGHARNVHSTFFKNSLVIPMPKCHLTNLKYANENVHLTSLFRFAGLIIVTFFPFKISVGYMFLTRFMVI